MPNSDSKTHLANDQPTETDAIDFPSYVESLDLPLLPSNPVMEIWVLDSRMMA